MYCFSSIVAEFMDQKHQKHQVDQIESNNRYIFNYACQPNSRSEARYKGYSPYTYILSRNLKRNKSIYSIMNKVKKEVFSETNYSIKRN